MLRAHAQTVAYALFILANCALSIILLFGFFVMQFEYKYTELGGVWDSDRLRDLGQPELSALAFEYELNSKCKVSAF